MNQIDKQSSGTPLITLQHAMASDWLNNVHTNTVSIPASMGSTMFLFSLKEEFKRMAAFKKVSDDTLEYVVGLVARGAGLLDANAIEGILKEAKINLKDGGKGVVEGIISGLQKTLINEAGGNFILETILDDQLVDLEDLSLTKVNFESIEQMIKASQDLFSKYANIDSVAELTKFTTSAIAPNELYRVTSVINSILNKTPGPTTRASLAYVVNQIRDESGLEKMYPLKSVIEGKVYKISPENKYASVRYQDLLAALIIGIRTVQGISTEEGDATMTLSKVVEHMVTGVGDVQPFIPTEAGDVDMGAAKEILLDRFRYYLIRRLAMRDPGSYMSSIDSIKEYKKYDKIHSINKSHLNIIESTSYVVSAFYDSVAWCKSILTDTNISLPGLHPLKMKKVTAFVYQSLDKYKAFTLSSDNPRFMNEPAHVMNHSVDFNYNMPEYVVPYGSANVLDERYFEDETSGEIRQWFRTTLMAGTYMDMNTEILPSLFSRMNVVMPYYFHTVPSPEIIKTYPIFAQMMSVYKGSSFLGKLDSRYRQWIKEMFDNEYISSVHELRAWSGLPLDVLGEIYSRASDYFKIREMSSMHIIVDFQDAPLYEMGKIYEDREDIPVAYAPYPFVSKRVISTGIHMEASASLQGLSKFTTDSHVPDPKVNVAAKDEKETAEQKNERDEVEKKSPEGDGDDVES